MSCATRSHQRPDVLNAKIALAEQKLERMRDEIAGRYQGLADYVQTLMIQRWLRDKGRA